MSGGRTVAASISPGGGTPGNGVPRRRRSGRRRPALDQIASNTNDSRSMDTGWNPVGRQLGVTAKLARARFEAELATVGGTLTAWIVLRQLRGEEGASQRELAERLDLMGPTLTHHLDRLEAEGL